MKMTFAVFFLLLMANACNPVQNKDTTIDSLTVQNDSTAVPDTPDNAEYSPYGKAKAEALDLARKNALEAILKARGVAPAEINALSAALANHIGFNEWDVVEEGESIETSGPNRESLTLTSLLFGPFDGNGRSYTVLAVTNNRIYVSDEHWEHTAIDSAYHIQMATDKRIEIG